MTLYSPRYDQLLQGVSRQHPSRRAVGQNSEQLNCISDIVQGLRRRPKFRLMSILNGNEDVDYEDDYCCHMYTRGDGVEAYIIIMAEDGDYQVWDAYTGEMCTSLANAYTSYITSGTGCMREKIGWYTIADKTFVWNKEVEVDESASTTDAGYDGFLIWCKRSMYGKTYNVRQGLSTTIATQINPAIVSVASGYVDKQLNLDTTSLANNLASQINSWIGASGASNNVNNVIWVSLAAGAWEPKDFNVDDTGNYEDVIIIKDKVDTIEDLPPYAPHGYIIEVSGLGKSDFDNFYVQYESDYGSSWFTQGSTTGKWVECAAPGISVGVDPSTMPLQLIRGWSGGSPQFYWAQTSWEDRAAGNETTNPMPSFVGSTIQDMFSYQNRLWFLSGENACASRAFDPLHLFAESVAQASDNDPIDSSSSDNQITNLKYGLTFNKDLFVLSNKSQFLHDGETSVKPGTFALSSNTTFPTNPEIKPVVMGNSLMFPSIDDNKVTVWEYRKDPVTGLPDANDITNHIGDYIPNEPRWFPWTISFIQMETVESIAAHPTRGMMFMASGGDIYVLQMFYKDNQRVQLAWHKWVIGQFQEAYGWWGYTDAPDGYYDRPMVSDVFVVDNKLIALARFDSRYTGSNKYYPRLIEMDLDLLTSTEALPEIFMDYSYETDDSVSVSGPYEYDGSFYDCYVELPYYQFGGDDPSAVFGDEHKEQYFNMIVTSSSDDTDACPNHVNLPYGWTYARASESGGAFAYDRVYFNCPDDWLSADFKLTLGCNYDSELELSPPYVRDQQGRAYTEAAVIDDVVLDMDSTVALDVEVDNAAGDGYTHEFNGLLLNDFRSELGKINHITGTEAVAVCNDRELCTVTVKSNGYYGFKLSGCTWHINMHTNGRRT